MEEGEEKKRSRRRGRKTSVNKTKVKPEVNDKKNSSKIKFENCN